MPSSIHICLNPILSTRFRETARRLEQIPVWLNELMLRMAHGQEGTGSLTNHLFSDAAQKDVRQPTPAVRAHDDEVDVLFPGQVDDLVEGRAWPDLGMDGQLAKLAVLDEPVQGGACRFQELLDGSD